ncbi:MAG: hypothetical protein KC442_23250 [Thermomicrobiales bacterium]|nr:hypothetical protein [Thermomicrobiales bacterium]
MPDPTEERIPIWLTREQVEALLASDQTEPLVTVAISPEVADDLLSAVGHYRQYTASVAHMVQGRASADDQSHLTRIADSMDAVAAQLLAQGVGH